MGKSYPFSYNNSIGQSKIDNSQPDNINARNSNIPFYSESNDFNNSNKISDMNSNYINNSNNIYNNGMNNNNYTNNNNQTNKSDNKSDGVDEDPDAVLFRNAEKNKNDKSKKEEEDENEKLSSEGEVDSDNDNEKDYNNLLLAQYEKVKRVKNKWKVVFKDCVIQTGDEEWICGKIHGDLDRDW